MSESMVIGVDVGATKILIGAVTPTGKVRSSRRFKMEARSQESALFSIHSSVESFLRDWNGPAPHAIGLGLVGLTDPQTGTWLEAMSLPIQKPVALAQQVNDRYGIPAALDNDVHAGALAELRWGIGIESSDFIYLNIGTGISTGLVCGGRLVRGILNYAGEFGHMLVQPHGFPCVCGRHGCLEPVASGGGMLKRVQVELQNDPHSMLHSFDEPLTTHQIFMASDAGDPLAQKVSGDAVQALSEALSNLVNLLNPEWIVCGGGALHDGWLMERVLENMEKRLLAVTRRSLKGIIPSNLNPEQVGLLGAACLALDIGGVA